MFFTENPASWAGEKNILDGEEKVSGVGWSNSVNNEKIMKTRFLRFFWPTLYILQICC